MHRSRRSEILLGPNSPIYRDNYAPDYISERERPAELSRRSRSLDCRRDFFCDDYYDDYDDRRFDRTHMANATLPRRRYDYQPFYVTQGREQRYYRDEPIRLQAIEAGPTNQSYSPRPGMPSDWRYDKAVYRDKSGSPHTPSTPRDDYETRGGGGYGGGYGGTYGGGGGGGYGGQSYQQSWHRNYYKDSGLPATRQAATSGGYWGTTNTMNRGGLAKPYPKTYPPRDPRDLKYRMIHCCCFNFRWPPWAVEEVEPPRPMYRHHY